MLKAPGHSAALLLEGADRSWGQPREIAHTCAHETDPGRAGDRGQVHTRILGLARGQHRKQSTRTIKLQSNFLITISTTQNFYFFLQKSFTKGQSSQPTELPGLGSPAAGRVLPCPAELSGGWEGAPGPETKTDRQLCCHRW